MNDKKQLATESTELTEGMQWFSLWTLCSLWLELGICR